MILEFDIPGPPSQEFEDRVAMCATANVTDEWPLDANYNVSIQVFSSSCEVRTITRLILKGMQGIVYSSDDQVCALNVTTTGSDKNQRCEVFIYAWSIT